MANQTPKGLLDLTTQPPKGLLNVDMDQAIKKPCRGYGQCDR